MFPCEDGKTPSPPFRPVLSPYDIIWRSNAHSLVSLRTQGIQFDAERLLDLGLDPATLYPHCVDRGLDAPEEQQFPIPIPTNPGPVVGVAPSEGTAVDEKGKGSMEKDPLEFSDADEKRAAASPSPKPVPVTRLVEEEKRAANVSADGTLIGDGDGDESQTRLVHVDTVRRTKTMTETETDFSFVHKSKTRTEDEDEEDSPGGVEDEKAYIRAVVESEFESTERERVIEVDDDDDDEAAADDAEDDVFRIPVEDEEDRKDALQREYDQLQAAWYWWILEFMPLRERVRRPDGSWKKKWWYVRFRFPLICELYYSFLFSLSPPPPSFTSGVPSYHISSTQRMRMN